MSFIAKYVFLLFGWRCDPLPDYFKGRHVIIVLPHTSNFDGFAGYLSFKILKVKFSVIMKSELFVFPFSVIFKWLGGIPVDRKKSGGIVNRMIEQFSKEHPFILSLAPEGTRSQGSRIKKGFWYIAKGADVSIILWYLDKKNRRVRWLGELYPGDSVEEDLQKIVKIYAKEGCILTI